MNRNLLLLGALTLGALAPSGLAAQARPGTATVATPPRRAPVTLLDVRLICLKPDSLRGPAMNRLCRLKLPRYEQLADSTEWRDWRAVLAENPALADSIRNSRVDPAQLPLREVLDNLGVRERAAVFERLFSDRNRLRGRVRALANEDILELYNAATDSAVQDTAGESIQLLASRLRSARQSTDSLPHQIVAAVRDSILRFEPAQLALLLSRVPRIEQSVLKDLAGDSTVATLLQKRSSDPNVRQILSRAAAQELVAGTSARPSSLSRQSDLLWGTTDFVVTRVQQQLQAYALRGFTARLCGDLGGMVLRESCQMLRSHEFGLSRPGVTLLRSAVRADLQALPYTTLDWTYARYADSLKLQGPNADNVLTALQVTRFALDAARGEDPWLALGNLGLRFAGAGDSVTLLRAALERQVDSLASTLSLGERVDSLSRELSAAQDRVRELAEDAAAQRERLRQRIAEIERLRDAARAELRARGGLVDLQWELHRARSQLADVRRHFEGLVVDSTLPVTEILLGLSALASTRFDALRLRNLVPPALEPEELIRFQLIATMANLQERGAPASAGELDFEPWRFVRIAFTLHEDFNRLQELRSELENLRRTKPDSTGVVRTAQARLAQGAFSAVENLLAEASQLPEFRGGAGLERLVGAQRIVEGVQEVVFPILDGDYSAGLLALSRQVAPYLPSNAPATQSWTRGIVFVSDLVNASSPDQVNTALAGFVDSGGGFMGKRTGRGPHLSLNAFGGAYFGFSAGLFSGEAAGGERAKFAGLYLPVGLELTTPWDVVWRHRRRLGRFGLFAQAIDLGALASWRLENSDDVEQRPEIGLAQVFSPGLFVVFDVHDAPLTLGYGWALSPALRTLTEDPDDPGEVQVDAVRRGFFIAFDIPLFP
ncbi:MAG TPA: hypothetical protein VF746_25460 [Longimicrobium sp.]|jgi:hypothetical protein